MSKFHSCVKKTKLVSQNIYSVSVIWFSVICISPVNFFPCRWQVRVQIYHLMVIIYLTCSKISSSCLKSYICVQGLVMKFFPYWSNGLIYGNNTGKQRYDGVPWSFWSFVLECLYPLCLKQVIVQKAGVASQDYKQPHLLSCQNNMLASTPFESCWIPTRCLSIGILC